MFTNKTIKTYQNYSVMLKIVKQDYFIDLVAYIYLVNILYHLDNYYLKFNYITKMYFTKKRVYCINNISVLWLWEVFSYAWKINENVENHFKCVIN